MICKSECSGRRVIFKFDIQESLGDRVDLGNVKMGQNSCFYDMPESYEHEKLHSDIYALAVILMVYPFLGNNLTLDRPISRQFSDAFFALTSKRIGPVSSDVKTRSAGANSRPALAFSGGVDSTAATALLPEDTVLVFLDRYVAPGMKTMYKKEAVNHACLEMVGQGREVFKINTDMEYLRSPVGFPVDVSNSVPALLLSECQHFDCVAFGMILESSYRLGHESFQNYPNRTHYKRWGGLFKAAGMPFSLVTAGISEVGTSKIVLNMECGSVAQSCMRGDIGAPCFNCWKCFRKLLLDKTLRSEPLTNEMLEAAFKIKEAKLFLSKDMIKHQNVLEYIAEKYSGTYPGMELLTAKVSNNGSVLYLEKWYGKSIELVPEKYQKYVSDRIKLYLEIMTPDEEALLESYSIVKTLDSERYQQEADRFKGYLYG